VDAMSDRDLVDYFIEQTNERFRMIEEKIDRLLAFKWQIIGGSLVASLVLTGICNALFLIFGGQ
jgi:hypothetical protein